jgi:hypothetical protein
MPLVKFSVSLLALSAFVFAGCNTPANRRYLYSPMTPGKNPGTWSVILREQSYLKGIDPKHLQPWTVKKKEEGEAVVPVNPLPATGATGEPGI